MEQKSKVIGNETYLVTQLDAISALKIQARLVKILGSGAVCLTNGGDLSSAIKGIMDNFDDELVVDFVLSLFERNVFIKSGDLPRVVDFSIDFVGKMTEMWKVVGFILETNFGLGELLKSVSPITGADNQKKED